MKMIHLITCALCLFALPYAEAAQSSASRHVKDGEAKVQAGDELTLTHADLLANFENAKGEASVSRLLLRPGRHGSIRVEPGQFVFIPDDGFLGAGVLEFEFKDDAGTLTGKVKVDIVPRVVEEYEEGN